tara:strand:- start:295 stop:519 length:225 start_codon:yes stop_codon:yes gene_type:complete
MDKIGWTDLRLNISHLGSQSVGKMPNMNEYAGEITTVNGLGTSAMTEGQVLLLTMVLVIVITLLINIITYGITG